MIVYQFKFYLRIPLFPAIYIHEARRRRRSQLSHLEEEEKAVEVVD
jgi:hypothetical protein